MQSIGRFVFSNRQRWLAFLAWLLMASSGASLAQEAATPPKGKGVKVGSRRLSIDFDDELVNGEKQNPDVEFLFNRKSSNFKRMIKLRGDFIPEVKRGRSEFGADKRK